MENRRWIITYDTGKGYHAMAEAAQGRHTHATEAAALEQLSAMRANNRPEKLASIFGERGAASLRVQSVDCWPGHNDPKRAIFDAEA